MTQSSHSNSNDPLPAADKVDVDWLAFQYIAGEMSDGELAQFETRLETCQQARDAVAAAVAEWEAIVVAESQLARAAEEAAAEEAHVSPVGVPTRFPWSATIGWVTAASLLVTLVCQWLPVGNSPAANTVASNAETTNPGVGSPTPLSADSRLATPVRQLDNLAVRWHETRSEATTDSIFSARPETTLASSGDETEVTFSDPTNEELDQLVVQTPSWMDSAFAPDVSDVEEEG